MLSYKINTIIRHNQITKIVVIYVKMNVLQPQYAWLTFVLDKKSIEIYYLESNK